MKASENTKKEKKGRRFARLDYAGIIGQINSLIEEYPCLSVGGVCESILGRTVPYITLGEGKVKIVYVGGERGNDALSTAILLRFVRDMASLCVEGGSAFGFPVEYLMKSYSFIVIPVLNPDGREYCINGVDSSNPLRERLVALNPKGEDFSCWEGNARGGDLVKNYALENSEYELECEVGGLCNFLKYGVEPQMLFVLSGVTCGGDVLYFGDGEYENKSAIALSQMSGIARRFRKSEGDGLLLADWVMENISCRAFSLELSLATEEEPKSVEGLFFLKYASLRKMLFCAPLLNKIK